jgi:hypothetical protein
MMTPQLFAPRSIPDVLFNHHILMMSFIAGRFIVEVCEAKNPERVSPG